MPSQVGIVIYLILCLLVPSADNLQTVWTQIKPDILSCLIWVHNVGPDLDPNYLTLIIFLKEFLEKFDCEKIQQT